jgi:DNA primase
MTCAEANRLELVDYLYSLGYTPTKIKGNDYWYLSPLRDERTASLKVNRSKNVWYDHGAGKGGSVVDFVMQHFNCDVQNALQKLSGWSPVNSGKISSTLLPSNKVLPDADNADLFTSSQLSFQQHNIEQIKSNTDEVRPPFHLHENSLIDNKHAAETALQIIAAKQPITDPLLCRYLKQRSINKTIADTYCYEVRFKMNNKDKEYTAIGFKNNAGGFELRNEYFKLSSSPKYFTYINSPDEKNSIKSAGEKNIEHVPATDQIQVKPESKNEHKRDNQNEFDEPLINRKNDDKKTVENLVSANEIQQQNQSVETTKSITVFEGFFDFLSYQTIHQKQAQSLTNFLVLNSLTFFERSLLLMEKHEHIHLYLDHDDAGRKCLELALKRSVKFKDESSLYKGYKDLNDWVMHFGKLQKVQSLKQSKGMRF